VQILPSQHSDLAEAARASVVGADVETDYRETVVWRYRPDPYRYAIVINESARNTVQGTKRGFKVTISPGTEHHEEAVWVPEWLQVVECFTTWLRNLERELRAAELRGETGNAPDWLTARLPVRMLAIRTEIRKLRDEASQLGKIAGLLWQTGLPLNESVRDALRQVGFDAELTPTAATYDVTVGLGQNRRLLLEVTGIDGGIAKSSSKIAQILQTTTKEAREGDRVVLAVNAFRQVSPEKRDKIITKDALDLVLGMKASIITTVWLYGVWELAASDPDAAKRRVHDLYDAPPQIFV
jgi:hypothetical protein